MALKSYSGEISPLDSSRPAGGLKPYSGEIVAKPQPSASTPRVAAKPQPRSWGEAVGDTAKALASGVGSVVKGGGTLYGLATGDMDNAATRLGTSVQDHWQGAQSDSLKARKQARSDTIDSADGVIGKALTAVKETVTDPGLLVDTVAESAASFLPAGAAGRAGAVIGGARALARGAKPAAAAATGARVGYGAAVGTGALQQGADVSGGAYDDAMGQSDDVWAKNPEFARRVAGGEDAATVKHELALGASREAFAPAAGVSVASQFIPGADKLERVVAGAAAKAGKHSGIVGRGVNALRGAAGEGAQEAIEEGAGQFAANVAQQRNTDPNRELGEGVGEAAGLGFVGGAGLGGPAGLMQRPAAAGDAPARRFASRPTAPGAAPAATSSSAPAAARPTARYPGAAPGSLADAANVIEDKPAVAPAAAATAVNAADTPAAAAPQPPAQAFPVPWVDTTTGEVRRPEDGEVIDAITGWVRAEVEAGRDIPKGTGPIVSALGLNDIGRSRHERNTLLAMAREQLDAPATAATAEPAQLASDDPLARVAEDSAELDQVANGEPNARTLPGIRGEFIENGAGEVVRRMTDRHGNAFTVPATEQEVSQLAAAEAAKASDVPPPATVQPTQVVDAQETAAQREVGAGPAVTEPRVGRPDAVPGLPAQAPGPDTPGSVQEAAAAEQGALPTARPSRTTPIAQSELAGASAEAQPTGDSSAPVPARVPASPQGSDQGQGTNPSSTLEALQPAPTGPEQPPVQATRPAQPESGAGIGTSAESAPSASSALPESPATQAVSSSAGSSPSPKDAPQGGAVQAAATEAATSPSNDRPEPTEAQKEAGNYKKGHVRFNGHAIAIENPAGTSRRPEWPPLANHYGYFKGTIGKDKDHVDVFMTDRAHDPSLPVFVVDQVDPKTGRFDEHKVVMGVATEQEARATYAANYAKDWQGLRAVTTFTQDEFKAWVKDPEKTKRPAAPPTRMVGGRKIKAAIPAKASSAPAKPAPGPEKPASAPAAVAAATPVAERIEDLGEKIGGARKDLSGGRKEKPAEPPHYVVVPSRTPGNWILRNSKTGKQVAAEGRFTDEADANARAEELNAARGAAKANEAAWRKRFAVLQNQSGRVDAKRWHVVDLRTGRALTGASGDTEQEAAALIPLAVVAQKHRARAVDGDKWEIWRNVTDRKSVKVVPQQFDSRDEAMRYMAQNAVEIIETNTRYGEEVLAKPETVKRKGPERRKGDVSGKDFMDTFGFRGVEFGNWNNQAERQEVMNHAYDGLHDLAELLDIPPKAISLNGDLALAFGARGQGLTGARAHYEPRKGVINLTKMKGAGALAHEWFHALDHYLGRVDGRAPKRKAGADGTADFGKNAGASDMLSHGSSPSSAMRPELAKKYRDLMQGLFTKAEEYVEDTQQAEKFAGRTHDNLAHRLQQIRDNLAKDLDPTYYKRHNKAATAAQLAEFDGLVAQLLGGPQEFEFRLNESAKKGKSFAGRRTNDALEAMSAIYKAVRGRSGFTNERTGPLDYVRHDAANHAARLKMLEDAKRADTKVRRVPTSFAMDAKRIDQGTVTDYWTTPHEMAARAFSAYVEDKLAAQEGASDFLSFGSNNDMPVYQMFGIRPFPAGREREALNAAFEDFFQTLETKETEQGVALYSRRGWDEGFPDAVLGADLGAVSAHPDYVAAKAGDDKAALRLARDLVSPAYVDAVRAALPQGAKPTIVPVLAEEAAGQNRIPAMVAVVLAEKLGLPFETGILQADKVGRGGSGGFHRLANQPGFTGEVKEGDYLVLDDTLTQGGTLAQLKTHIEDNGGRVLLASALTGKQYSRKLALSPESLAAVRERFGSIENWWRDTFGYGFEGLTESEARFVLNLRDRPTPDALRARIDAARVSAVDGVGPGNDSDRGNRPALSVAPRSASSQRLSFDRAQQLKTELTADWGENAPRVVLVESAEELQQAAGLPRAILKDPDFYRAEGVYRGKPTVWINIGAIRSEKRFGEVLAHEALGHYGVERVVGQDQWAGIVDAIERLERDGTGSGQTRKILEDVRRLQPGLSRENFAKEVIAFMAERGQRNGLIGKVVAAVRRFLRKIMPSLRWREIDVRALLGQADSFLRSGRSRAERVQAVQAYAFSKDEGAEVSELALDPAFVAGLSPDERKSGAMQGLAVALYADLGTESPFFRNWFGESKVLDAKGEPLKVYHGTANEFDAFDANRAGKNTNHLTAHLGIFFDARRSKAEHYARVASNDVPAEERIIEAHLSIAKPYVMSKAEFMGVDSSERARALRARLEREGFDGIQLPEVGQWIAFRPEQIKATANRGTFDRGDARLLFSKAAASGELLQEIQGELRAINEAVSGSDRSVVDRARGAIKELTPKGLQLMAKRAKDATRGTWLGALTTRHLTELGSDYFDGMRVYSQILTQMGADRNQLAEEGEALAESLRTWAGKNRETAKALFALMHQATIDGVDPSKEYTPWELPKFGGVRLPANRANLKEFIKAQREVMIGRGGDAVGKRKDRYEAIKQARAIVKGEPRRKATYPTLVEQWNALPPEAQQLYAQMRDMYSTRRDLVEEALVQRIQDLKLEGGDQVKAGMIASIREQFEDARLQGVYFPLQRFGQYFVAAERDGTPVFMMFESLTQLEQAEKQLRDRGFTVKARGMKGDAKAKDAPSEGFVADVLQKLDKGGVSESMQDEIYQLFLHQLPELSMRKHAIHRKSVPGFDDDAARAFAFNMHHGAHQLARLRHSHKLAATIDLLKAQQKARSQEEGEDTRRIAAGDAILQELDRRHEWISNPQDSALVNRISSAGFIYYLGLSPASALVNLTQTALVTYPYLASRFGAVKAMNHLLAAGRDAGRTLGNIQKALTDPEEIEAHRYLQRIGAIDKTQAHNLAGIAEGGLKGYNPGWSKAMEIIGWGFHRTEIMNREASGMAAFRLAKAEGKSFAEAVQIAAETIHDTHFDYTNANRARFMQSGTAKVLLMFRQYSLNMTWHLGRMVWQASKGQSPEVKQLARRNLAGVLGMSALFSGAMGLPLASATMGVLNAIASSFGDDDEPWEAETELRAFLTEMMGPGPASLLLGGVVNEVTGADIAGRVSLSQLWFRDADRELDGRGAYYNLLEQAAGPMGGVLKNALVGKQLMDEGHLWRGVETVLPKSLKDMVKSARYAAEGVNNLRGDAIVEDLNLGQVLLQLNGFAPAEVAERYDRNRSLKNYERHVLDRRQHLIDAYAMAQRTGDQEGKQAAWEAMKGFNQKWPELGITSKALRRSLAQRARYTKQAEGGIVLNQKLAARLKQAVGEE